MFGGRVWGVACLSGLSFSRVGIRLFLDCVRYVGMVYSLGRSVVFIVVY